MENLSSLEAALRLMAATLCGAAVGWERGHHKKPAGLRTHVLVATGTATFVVIALRYVSTLGPEGPLMIDPTRVLQGILAGVGLIAGGSIIQERGSVRGLTTAATIWGITAVGAACGFGQYDIAVMLTLLILLSTSVLVRLDPKEHPENVERLDEEPDPS